MAAPATTTNTTPAPSESKTTSDSKQQEAPPPAPRTPTAEFVAPPKKRKLVELGFHNSPYYKIRATVSNLRGRFLQVCDGTDSQKKDATLELLKMINVLMEFSKKKRLDLYSVAEPMKPSVIPTTTTSKDEPAGKIPSAQKNQVLPINLAGNFLQNAGGNILLKPDNLEASVQKLVSPVEIKEEARASKMSGHTKQPGEDLQGSYVIGGSPNGFNFLMWPGSKVAYYGLTKAEWLARQPTK